MDEEYNQAKLILVEEAKFEESGLVGDVKRAERPQTERFVANI